MTSYPTYCRTCADQHGHRPTKPSTDHLDTPYQQSKFGKHSTPVAPSDLSSGQIISFIHNPDPETYNDAVNSAYERGAVEIGPRGRNLIYPPSVGSAVGEMVTSTGTQPADAFMVCLSTSTGKAHGYLVKTEGYGNCSACGKPLFHANQPST